MKTSLRRTHRRRMFDAEDLQALLHLHAIEKNNPASSTPS